MAAFYALTMFVSALLLFLVQPMVGKMILPLLGGTPAVWNTCMVFFQALLLAGYGYAHFSTQRLGARRQAHWHLAILILPLLALAGTAAFASEPVHVVRSLAPQGSAYPFFGVVILLAVTIGLPFFVVSTTAPLLQRWFADTDHRNAADPYFLYGASNLGSLLALAVYPALMEPTLRLAHQGWVWALGYAGLAGLIYGCVRRLDAAPKPKKAAELAGPPPTCWTRLRWVLLAFAPASLLLGVTTFATTDIAPIPLIWVIPLALYLLTFVIAFGRHPQWLYVVVMLVAPAAILILLFMMVWDKKMPLWVLLSGHFFVFFLAALMCHMVLVSLRPSGQRSTEFYVWMSLGGVLGGLFNALVAPLVFKNLTEYPLALILACFLTPPSAAKPKSENAARVLDVLIPLVLFGVMNWLQKIPSDSPKLFTAVGWLSDWTGGRVSVSPETLWVLIVLAWPALVAYYWFDRPIRFGLSVLAFWAAATLGYEGRQLTVLHEDRSFFGRLYVRNEVLPINLTAHPIEAASNTQPIIVDSKNHGLQSGQYVRIWNADGNDAVNRPYFWRVTVLGPDRFSLDDSKGDGEYTGGGQWHLMGLYNRLDHGTTLHGKQLMVPSSDEPLTYYHRTGPLGQIFRAVPMLQRADIAAIGLGTGSVAAYGAPTNSMTFYEIDPLVRGIASNPKYFRYITDCKAGQLDFVLGDARIKLEEHGKPGQYGLIIVDAFSSDAIPVHLLTKEAVQLYADRLRDDGIIALHVSNRYLSLTPIASRIAQELGLYGLQIYDTNLIDPAAPDADDNKLPGKQPSQWVILTKKRENFGKLLQPPGTMDYEGRTVTLTAWSELEAPGDTPLWTDDFSNILSVMTWK
jgi:hypothetical protein